jgi:putative aldouronate transport system permease protein
LHAKRWKRNSVLYLFLLPALLYYAIFNYGPMYGTVIAFMDYNPFRGIAESPWVGLRHFYAFFDSIYFFRLIRNTFLLGAYSIVFGFAVPIVFALLLNEMNKGKLRSVFQSISYLPHFISTVVVAGLIVTFLSPSTGVVNALISAAGGQTIDFMREPGWFRAVYVSSGIWQQMGWSSIIYFAALSGISPSLYEAADIDGAGRLDKVWNISLPGILPTIVTMFLLDLGRIMDVGFEKVFLLYNSSTYETADVLSTYVYRAGLEQQQYSFAAAVGLFNSLITLAFIILFNKLARRLSGNSLW